MILQSPLFAPPVRHLFATRQGGVGTGFLASCNIAHGKSDSRTVVQDNRNYLCGLLGGTRADLAMLVQTHSATVVRADAPEEGQQEGDALITTVPGLIIGVQTADCVPILIADVHSECVAAIHAGWRGALAGIIQKTVEMMREIVGDHRPLHAAIGPCIWQESYEVGPDFLDQFTSPQRNQFLKPSTRAGHQLFDLPGYARAQIQASGVHNITDSPYNTFAHPELFFSCRRATLQNEPEYGCSLSAIIIQKTQNQGKY